MITLLIKTVRAYKNKLTNKLFGVVHVPAQGKKKSDVLISFITEPFIKAPWESFSDPHTNPWVCAEIIRLLTKRGYAVDVINWDNTHFVPKKEYSVFIDMHTNIQRLLNFLPNECLKILFITGSEAGFQNRAEQKRLDNLYRRRGVRLKPQRKVPLSDAPKYADQILGSGNKTVHNTFSKFGKQITPLPTPVMAMFDFPEEKNFSQARTSFLWFGGGGLVHKGLDLVLEALANTEYELHIVGPISSESDFITAYKKELEMQNVHLYPRPRIDKNGKITINNEDFMSVMNRCSAVIFPSASEGGGASAVQAMHAGLIPIITKESGIPDNAPAVIIEPTVQAIRDAARTIAKRSPQELAVHAREVWKFSRVHCTQEVFRKTLERFFDTHLPN